MTIQDIKDIFPFFEKWYWVRASFPSNDITVGGVFFGLIMAPYWIIGEIFTKIMNIKI